MAAQKLFDIDVIKNIDIESKIRGLPLAHLKAILKQVNEPNTGKKNQLTKQVLQLTKKPHPEIIHLVEKSEATKELTKVATGVAAPTDLTILDHEAPQALSCVQEDKDPDSSTVSQSSKNNPSEGKQARSEISHQFNSHTPSQASSPALEVRSPLSPISSNRNNRMSHQPYYSQRLQQQQKQAQMAQQAAVLSLQQQNHGNMYQAGGASIPHYYMRPMANPAPLGPKLPDRHPSVKFKVLPFFDMKHELIPISSLQPTNTSSRNQEVSFQFKLTNQQAAELGENREIIPGVRNDWHYQVQLRIASLNTTTEQDDHYPPNLAIKVNQRAVQLPNPIPSRVQNKEPIRPSRPLNISPLCKICPFVMNIITVNWTYEFNNNDFYVMKVEIVKKLTSTDLLDRLKNKGIKPVEYTTKIIREKLSETDCEIATDTLQVNLACPLSRTRMTIPCRASTCTHLQCFDAIAYLQMNEKKQTWVCPVCNQPCQYGNLFIDGYFLQVLESCKDHSEIILCKDGTWSAYVPPKDERAATKAAASDIDLSIVCLDDDDPPAPSAPVASVIKNGSTEAKAGGISIPIPSATAAPPPPPEIEEICLD
ncbi:hypothetical protein M8J75_010065 [Diaphorina citri]|nr:hypothetical protein M8J75_010065 [Diaphorina citri]